MSKIFKELEDKIEELKSLGESDDNIKKLGKNYLMEMLKKAPYKERSIFFTSVKRDLKLKQILD